MTSQNSPRQVQDNLPPESDATKKHNFVNLLIGSARKERLTLEERALSILESCYDLPNRLIWLSDARSWLLRDDLEKNWRRVYDHDVDSFLLQLVSEVARIPLQDHKPEEREEFHRELQTLRKRAGVEALRWHISATREFHSMLKEWDTNPEQIGTPAGILDLRTGIISPWTRESKISRSAQVVPKPPASPQELEEFLTFLNYITAGREDVRERILRWLGYLLTAHTREEKMLLLIGEPRIGKSTLVDILNAILGNDYMLALSPSVFCERQKTSSDTGYARAKVVGRRVIAIDEFASGEKLDEEYLKTFIAGGLTSVREIRGNLIENVRIGARLVATSNHIPLVLDGSGAMSSRVDLIELPARRPEKENRSLKENLTRKAPFIFWYIIEHGAKPYLREWSLAGTGTDFSRNVKMSGSVGEWTEKNFKKFNPLSAVRAGSAFAHYQEWCESEGIRWEPKKYFPGILENLGFKRITVANNKTFYLGLDPVSPEEFASLEPELARALSQALTRRH